MSSPVSLSHEDRKLFSDFTSIPWPLDGETHCLVRVRNERLSFEADNKLRRLWISFTGARKEYCFPANMVVLSDLIQRGIKMIMRETLDEEMQIKVRESFRRYQKLIGIYAERHHAEGFDPELFRLGNIPQPLRFLQEEESVVPPEVIALFHKPVSELSPGDLAFKIRWVQAFVRFIENSQFADHHVGLPSSFLTPERMREEIERILRFIRLTKSPDGFAAVIV